MVDSVTSTSETSVQRAGDRLPLAARHLPACVLAGWRRSRAASFSPVIWEDRKIASSLLTLRVGDLRVNCHFFQSDDLELDIRGYWLIGADGGVYAFGDAPFLGSLPGLGQHVSNVVGIMGSGASGYAFTTSAATVTSFGTMGTYLPAGPLALNAPVVDITPPVGVAGYWLIAKDGGVFAYGNAPYEGSLPELGIHVTDIVGSAALL